MRTYATLRPSVFITSGVPSGTMHVLWTRRRLLRLIHSEERCPRSRKPCCSFPHHDDGHLLSGFSVLYVTSPFHLRVHPAGSRSHFQANCSEQGLPLFRVRVRKPAFRLVLCLLSSAMFAADGCSPIHSILITSIPRLLGMRFRIAQLSRASAHRPPAYQLYTLRPIQAQRVSTPIVMVFRRMSTDGCLVS